MFNFVAIAIACLPSRHARALADLLQQFLAQLARPLATRVFGTAEEIGTAAAGTQLHRRAALRARLRHFDRWRRGLLYRLCCGECLDLGLLLQLGRQRLVTAALGVSA